MRAADEGRAARGGVALLLAAIVLLAFQLRSPLVALAPVAAQAQRDWAVTPAAFGLLTTVPLLCFGLATPAAPWLARRVGVEGAIEICIGGVVVATVLRSIDGFGVAVASVVLLGLAITIGNVLVPTVIRRDVPARGRAAATSIYSVAINVGTVITSLATVPLAAAVGWRTAVAAWSVGRRPHRRRVARGAAASPPGRVAGPAVAPAARTPFRPDAARGAPGRGVRGAVRELLRHHHLAADAAGRRARVLGDHGRAPPPPSSRSPASPGRSGCRCCACASGPAPSSGSSACCG